MSNGELDKPTHPYAGIKFDRATLASKLALRTTAVQDATGDLQGAEERMRATIVEAQRDVDSRKEALSGRKEEALNGLEELGLVSRAIEFTAGKALAAVDLSDPENPYVAEGAEGEDLAGSGGTITGVEMGTFLGNAIHPPESVVLFVDMDQDRSHLNYAVGEGYRYAVVADQAEFTTGEIPQPEE
ncbi:MAG TPA: hypothetical protein VFX84_02405 [Candidatus Saccharimonadales bacterium]|nr:hypothetical protein [Candidatus Saccharimonadales bacterium]